MIIKWGLTIHSFLIIFTLGCKILDWDSIQTFRSSHTTNSGPARFIKTDHGLIVSALFSREEESPFYHVILDTGSEGNYLSSKLINEIEIQLSNEYFITRTVTREDSLDQRGLIDFVQIANLQLDEPTFAINDIFFRPFENDEIKPMALLGRRAIFSQSFSLNFNKNHIYWNRQSAPEEHLLKFQAVPQRRIILENALEVGNVKLSPIFDTGSARSFLPNSMIDSNLNLHIQQPVEYSFTNSTTRFGIIQATIFKISDIPLWYYTNRWNESTIGLQVIENFNYYYSKELEQFFVMRH